MPGKRSRSGRKRKPSTPARAPRVSPRRLLEQAREVLADGDGRKALDVIRKARDRDQSLAELPLLSFCACMQRARQLAAKSMDREAATMRAHADRHRAAIATPALPEEDWVLYVRHLDGADALAAYASHLADGRPIPRVERALADALVVQRCWEGLDAFDASHPLRRDGPSVRPSVRVMDAGDWARAAGLLRAVPRRSPFAPWRLFCKAMVCFDAGDDDGLRRALDDLPADFALAGTVAAYRRLIDNDGDGCAGAPQGLGSERGRLAGLAGEVRRALRKGHLRALGTAIERLADALYPEDPREARIDLLEIVALAAARGTFPVPALAGLAQPLVPPERVNGVLARMFVLGQEVTPPLWNPTSAVMLLQELPAEFPRPEDRHLARACVLESLARTGRAAIDPESLPRKKTAHVAALLGRPVEDPATIFSELMAASLEADPDNRDGYLFLLDLLREQGAGKPQRQRVLEEMADRFPTIRGPGWRWPACTTRGTPTAGPRARWRRPGGGLPTTTGSWICRRSVSSNPPIRAGRPAGLRSRRRTSSAPRSWDAVFSGSCCPRSGSCWRSRPATARLPRRSPATWSSSRPRPSFGCWPC